jgi:lipoprotein-releasing system permease protein
MISRGTDFAQAADLYGIPLDTPAGAWVTEIEEELVPQLSTPPPSGGWPLLAGSRLTERMVLFPGDTVLLTSTENVALNPMGGIQPAVRQFEVVAAIETGMYDYDIKNLYASLDRVQSLLGFTPDQVSGLGVRISDPWLADDVALEVLSVLGISYFSESWITTNQALFSALELEKIAMGVILFLIVVVAAFNIVSTLVMVVVDRTSEIGILKSMGMTDGQVLRIFLLQGMAIGILGTFLGTGLGLLASWVLNTFEVVEIPAEVYFIEQLPVAVDPYEVLLIVGSSLLVSLLATIYPALQASRLVPVEAIRHE